MKNVNVLLIGKNSFSNLSKKNFSDNFSHELLEGWRRYLHDGIKQINQVNFTINSIHKEKLYTHILVNLTRLSTNKLEYLLE